MAYQIFRSKRFYFFLVLPFLLWSSYQVYQSKTLMFSAARITSTFSCNPDLAVEEPAGKELDKLNGIFRQKFRFLAVGSQSYAFESEDGEYVVKFFIMKHKFAQGLRSMASGKSRLSSKKSLSIFNSYKLAYANIPEKIPD